MPRTGDVDTETNRLLWTIGWNWVYLFIGSPIVGIAAGIALDGVLGILGLLLFFIGPVVAIVGLVSVRSNYGSVLSSGTDTVKEVASDVARLDGENVEQFTLLNDTGSSSILLPAPKREVATLLVSDSLLLVHDDAKVNLPGLSWSVGDSTNEFYFDQITGVNFNPYDDAEGGEFWVNLSDEYGESWESETGAETALAAVQDRIREYKAR